MNVLVTGGSRGIGEACVRAFCGRGDRVIFFYRTATAETVKRLERDTGAVGICADVTDPEAVSEAMDEVFDEFQIAASCGGEKQVSAALECFVGVNAGAEEEQGALHAAVRGCVADDVVIASLVFACGVVG